jgi:imidazolonepropionase-like amidohydrolase
MRRTRLLASVLIGVSLLPGGLRPRSTAAAQAPPALGAAGPIALVGGTLIDGVAAAPIRNAVVLIRESRIERVGTVETLAVPAGYTTISTEGLTVMPGLWDMHVHLLYAGHTDLQYWHRTYTSRYEREIMPATARQLLYAGVTSVRDMGAPPDAIFGIKRRIAAGELEGPTIYAAGPQLTHMPPDWAQQYRWGVSGREDAAARADRLLAAGADLLKVTDAESMTVDEVRAITDRAHASSKRVSAHGRTDPEIRLGLAAGVDDFQHIGVGNGGAPYPGDVIEAIRARVATGQTLYWTPTVGLALNSDVLRGNPEMLDAPANYEGLPPLVAADVRKAVLAFRPQPAAHDAISQKVKQLIGAGVELLVGTDSGLAGAFHSQSTWQEMDAWVRVLGIDPMETIRRATSVAATALGAARESGSIESGRYADVLVVGGDPLRHMDVLRAPVMVFKHGRRIR